MPVDGRLDRMEGVGSDMTGRSENENVPLFLLLLQSCGDGGGGEMFHLQH